MEFKSSLSCGAVVRTRAAYLYLALLPHIACFQTHARTPIAIRLRRDFAGLDFAAPAPEDVRVAHRDAAPRKVRVDGGLVREHELLVGAMRHAHHVHVPKPRPALAPVSVRHDVM